MCTSQGQSPRRQASFEDSSSPLSDAKDNNDKAAVKKPSSSDYLYTSQQVKTMNSITKQNGDNCSTNSPRHNDRRQKHQRHNVAMHNYHDHSDAIDHDRVLVDRVARGGVVTPFPIKLHQMLDQAQKDGHSDLVSWQPHGRCFIVHKPKEFAKEVMTTHFKQCTKLPSFQRQLNLYGFQRLAGKGPDRGGYYHEYFLRGKVFLAHHIERVRVKGTGVRGRSNPRMEPNFYAMKQVGAAAAAGAHKYDSSPDSAKQDKARVASLATASPPPPPPPPPHHEQVSVGQEGTTSPLDDDNIACRDVFEGMHFHPIEYSGDTTIEKQEADEAFWSGPPVRQELKAEEDMESFVSHLAITRELYRDILSTVDDDISFGDLLLRVIQE